MLNTAGNDRSERLIQAWHTRRLPGALTVARLNQRRADQCQFPTVCAGNCGQRLERVVDAVAALVCGRCDDWADHAEGAALRVGSDGAQRLVCRLHSLP